MQRGHNPTPHRGPHLPLGLGQHCTVSAAGPVGFCSFMMRPIPLKQYCWCQMLSQHVKHTDSVLSYASTDNVLLLTGPVTRVVQHDLLAGVPKTCQTLQSNPSRPARGGSCQEQNSNGTAARLLPSVELTGHRLPSAVLA